MDLSFLPINKCIVVYLYLFVYLFIAVALVAEVFDQSMNPNTD